MSTLSTPYIANYLKELGDGDSQKDVCRIPFYNGAE